jgi:hypothetical protein
MSADVLWASDSLLSSFSMICMTVDIPTAFEGLFMVGWTGVDKDIYLLLVLLHNSNLFKRNQCHILPILDKN